MAKLHNKKKRHGFIDCTGFSYRDSLEEREKNLTSDVRLIKCGQCKGRILDKIRALDWLMLERQDLGLIMKYYHEIKKQIAPTLEGT
jgi:DNA-directed RNA polymerase subunit RPC12/RpoP